jgi:Flp pilus assembly protein TadD
MEEAIELFRTALRFDSDSAVSHWHLGAALAQTGAREEAIGHLQRSVDLDPTNQYARNDLAAVVSASSERRTTDPGPRTRDGPRTKD